MAADLEPTPSYGLKLNWAAHHLAHLRLGVDRWLHIDRGAALVVTEEGANHQVCRFRLVKPMPRELTLYVGDCIHAARQALDHLAYALSIKVTGSDPPTNERSSEFPLFTPGRGGNRDKFDGSLKAKVGAIKDDLDPDLYLQLERFQPYNGGTMEMLGALDELDRLDKHRFLPLVAGVGQTENWSFQNMELQGWPQLRQTGALEDGTIVAEWNADARYNGGVTAKLDTNMLFAKDSTVLPDAIVLNVLQNIVNRIGGDVIPNIERFL